MHGGVEPDGSRILAGARLHTAGCCRESIAKLGSLHLRVKSDLATRLPSPVATSTGVSPAPSATKTASSASNASLNTDSKPNSLASFCDRS